MRSKKIKIQKKQKFLNINYNKLYLIVFPLLFMCVYFIFNQVGNLSKELYLIQHKVDYLHNYISSLQMNLDLKDKEIVELKKKIIKKNLS